MRNAVRISLATVVVGLLLTAPAVGQEIEVEYDRFTDTTTVSTGDAQGQNPFAMVASYRCAGDQLCRPTTVRVLFGKTTEDLTYQNEPTVIFLLDGETRLRADQVVTDRSYESGSYIEYVLVQLPPEELAQITAADRVEYQIEGTEGALTDVQLSQLQQLHAKIESVSNE